MIEQSLKEYIGKKEHPIAKEVSKLAIDIKRNSNYKEMIKTIITAREKQVRRTNTRYFDGNRDVETIQIVGAHAFRFTLTYKNAHCVS